MLTAVRVNEQSQVAGARREALAQANRLGFGEEHAGRVALVATELATNLVKHVRGGGEMLAGIYEDATGSGVELFSLDRGAGMANLVRNVQDGYSTTGSPGTGLGAVIRLSETSEVWSRPGRGTAVLARCSARRRRGAASSAVPAWGGIAVSKAGEEVCGDAWCVGDGAGARTLMVADGLGHGPDAAVASHEALRIFRKRAGEAPAAMLEAMHAGLRGTRGAAVSVARIDPDRKVVVFAGVGNVGGALVSGDQMRRMVSHNGTVGHVARRFQEFEYPYGDGSLVVLTSDGIASGWTLDRYAGVTQVHPSLIAALIYRDFARGRDDATVLVGKPAGLT